MFTQIHGTIPGEIHINFSNVKDDFVALEIGASGANGAVFIGLDQARAIWKQLDGHFRACEPIEIRAEVSA